MLSKIDLPPLAGGANTNHFILFDDREALLRVPRYGRPDEDVAYYYHKTGFTSRDNGWAYKRGPQEQYDFSRCAAAAGLAVLPPLALERNNVVYPYLSRTQTLKDLLQAPAERDLDVLTQTIFADFQKAHSRGFIYGDRNPTNTLIDPYGFVHIDFDWSLSGPTAAEFEVAEAASFMLLFGKEAVFQGLATTLGTMSAQCPGWIDLEKSIDYMHGMGQIMHDALGYDERILTDIEALGAATLTMRDSSRSR